MGRKNCGSCHRRSDSSVTPRFPVHKDCTSCHLVQFTAANTGSSVNPICIICHTSDGLNSSKPPLKSFPKLASFAADFDHAQHLKEKESARPIGECSACHTASRRGVGQTIPARLDAHRICYDCHSPGKSGNEFASCGSCHRLGSYSATSTKVRAYNLSFSHADHGTQERLKCENCHTVNTRGLPQSKQVSSIIPVQHLVTARSQNCKACHNQTRAFGDFDTRDCKRCHRRDGFRMVD